MYLTTYKSNTIITLVLLKVALWLSGEVDDIRTYNVLTKRRRQLTEIFYHISVGQLLLRHLSTNTNRRMTHDFTKNAEWTVYVGESNLIKC